MRKSEAKKEKTKKKVVGWSTEKMEGEHKQA